jgi:hypothetical protein
MRNKTLATAVLAALALAAPTAHASSHREAPITALDRPADITDLYAFMSFDKPGFVTLVLNVDPLLEPSNGPNYFPFDPDILYQIYVDNDQDALPDVTFQFRFNTEIRAPGLFTGFVGVGGGVNVPANAPLDLNGKQPKAGSALVPPAITALDGKGSEGFSLRQTYHVTMITKGEAEDLGKGQKLIAVPSNVGSSTMPDYPKLAKQGIYTVDDGIRVFAGTVDDPFFIDVGAAFDTLHFRMGAGGGVLSAAQDANDRANFASDQLSGFNVNSIAIEVPVAMLTSDGEAHAATSPKAVIGTWATTSRQRVVVQHRMGVKEGAGPWRQIQRLGNPLINELIIGTGSKDKWSMSKPKDDAQFAPFDLDPLLARVFNAVFGIEVPNAPRKDLLLLVQYLPPIAPAGTPTGPVADLLRLNTGVPATPAEKRSRLGAIAGDLGGYPNGRRLADDVLDISARAVAGVLAGAPYNVAPYTHIGDGVNVNDVPLLETFPYVGYAHSGRDRRHIDAGEPGGGPLQ